MVLDISIGEAVDVWSVHSSHDGCTREGKKEVDGHVCTRANNNDGTEIITL